jgi:hypothetical protein
MSLATASTVSQYPLRWRIRSSSRRASARLERAQQPDVVRVHELVDRSLLELDRVDAQHVARRAARAADRPVGLG